MVADVISRHSKFTLGKFVVEGLANSNNEISEEEFLRDVNSRKQGLVLGIGGIRDLRSRFSVYEKFVSLGYDFPSLISDLACVSPSSRVRPGSVILPFVNLGPHSLVEEGAICNTGSNLEHGSVLGKGSHLSTSAVVNGDCNVGHFSFVGSNATLEQGVMLRECSFVKMGTVVTRASLNQKELDSKSSDSGSK